jgi:hypothetical protein
VVAVVSHRVHEFLQSAAAKLELTNVSTEGGDTTVVSLPGTFASVVKRECRSTNVAM